MPKLTDATAVAGGRVVHALQGGGLGLQGKHLAGWTWCGLRQWEIKTALVETQDPVTCRVCLRIMAAFKQREDRKRG